MKTRKSLFPRARVFKTSTGWVWAFRSATGSAPSWGAAIQIAVDRYRKHREAIARIVTTLRTTTKYPPRRL